MHGSAMTRKELLFSRTLLLLATPWHCHKIIVIHSLRSTKDLSLFSLYLLLAVYLWWKYFHHLKPSGQQYRSTIIQLDVWYGRQCNLFTIPLICHSPIYWYWISPWTQDILTAHSRFEKSMMMPFIFSNLQPIELKCKVNCKRYQ